MRTPSSRSYTLVELLVVVAVVGVLATLALPNLLEARLEAEAGRLVTQNTQIEAAWTELLGEPGVSVALPEFAASVVCSQPPNVPARLRRVLPALEVVSHLGPRQVVVDANGKPVQDPHDPTGYAWTQPTSEALTAAGGVEVRSYVNDTSVYRSLQSEGMSGLVIAISYRSRDAHGRRVLELAYLRWKAAGERLHVVDWGTQLEVIVYPRS